MPRKQPRLSTDDYTTTEIPTGLPHPRRRKTDTSPTGIIVVIPAYNEERFIGSIVLMARRYVGEVIVVDDGSIDHTAELAEAAGALVIRLGGNQGKGAALSAGILAALGDNPNAIAVMDADFQHLPQEIPRLVAPIIGGQADLVIGSRYLRRTSRVPLERLFGHRLFNWLTWLASGKAVTDSQSGFRAFSLEAAKKLAFHSKDFAVETEMQFIAKELNLRLREVPITVQYLDQPKRPLLYHGLSVLRGLVRLVGQYRPLLFFGLPGLSLIAVGGIDGLWVINRFYQIQKLAIGNALTSVLFLIVGLTFFSTGLILHSVRGLLTETLKRERH